MKTLLLVFAFVLVSCRLAAAPLVSASTPAQPGSSAAGNSFNPIFSADGRHLVFVSHANNLVANDDLGLSLDVFVRDLVNSNTVLVSVGLNGSGGANADANYPGVSSNGQFIAFASRASNLVSGDANDAADIFLRDVVNGTTRLVSVDVNGNSPVDPAPSLNVPLSGYPQISADGRWVFFESRASNLLATGAPLGSVNIYARDTWSNLTVLASAGTAGNVLAGDFTLAGVTPDARYVAFSTTNTAVVAGVTNRGPDVYVRDMLSGTTLWASSNAVNFVAGSYSCAHASLAESGGALSFLAIESSGVATPLLFDLSTRATTRIATQAVNFTISNSPPAISADASVVAFEVIGYSGSEIWLWQRASNALSMVYQSQPNYPQYPAQLLGLSRDGRSVLFVDGTFGLASNAVLGVYQLYRKDIVSSATQLISATTSNTVSASSHQFTAAVLSTDGNSVSFDSVANDLAIGDFNGASDVFVRDANASATELITKAASQRPASTASSYSLLGPNSISADGRYVVTMRLDDPSAYRDTNGWADVFVSDALSGTTVAVSVNSTLFITNSSGGGAPTVTFVENTNAYDNPVISANGNAVVAVRRPQAFYRAIVGASATNGTFVSSGLSLLTRPASGFSVGGHSDSPSLNADGTLMAFRSDDTHFEQFVNDGNNLSDIWLRYPVLDLDFGGALRQHYVVLSGRGSYGPSGNGPSIAPTIAADGSLVSFATRAGDLVPAAAGGSPVQYPGYQIVAALLDTNRAATNFFYSVPKRLCSYTISFQSYDWIDAADTNIHHTNLNAVLTPLSVESTNAVLSANNRFLVFSAVDGSAIWRHDLRKSQTNYTFVSYAPFPNDFASIVATNIVPAAANILVCTNGRNPSVSADGNVVAYERVRAGSSLVDVFARDLANGEEALVSANLSGAGASGTSLGPLVSAEGRYVIFQSKASDLVPNDANGANDIFVRDRVLGVTMLVSANGQGLPGNGPSTRPVMAADGRTVAFQSFASDLASGDYNDKRDIFVLKLGGADTDGDGMDDDWEVAYFGNLSRDGNGDFDGDGASDRAEFLAGTDPTNNGSVFRVLTVAPVGGGARQLIWSGNPSRSYRAEFKDELGDTNWTALNGTISWNGSTATITDPNANSAHRYYRVVRLP